MQIEILMRVELMIGDWYAGQVDCFAISEDASPDLKNVELVTRRDGQERRITLHHNYLQHTDLLLQAIAKAAWIEAKSPAIDECLEEAWAERNPEAARDYWDDDREVRTHAGRL